jgi:rhodanese-related sulfurtransferase
MAELSELFKEMDFSFFGSGEHGMSVEGMRKTLGNDHFLFLDVRTDEEAQYIVFPFAKRIPLNQLPERMDELPKDKCIVTFCPSIFRAAVAFTLLRANGYEEVKGLTASMEEMVKAFKPGPLFNM